MVHLRCLVLVALSFATFGGVAATLHPTETSVTRLPHSTAPHLSHASGHEEQTIASDLLMGRTNGEEYPPWVTALKKRPFDEFGAPSWATEASGSGSKRQKVVPHPAPLRSIVPSNRYPPLHPDVPKPLPGMWDGEIQYKKPMPSGPKVYKGQPYRKKKSKKATWPEPWSATFGLLKRPGKKQFPVKHAKSYQGYQTKLHKVQDGGVRKPKLKRTKRLHFSKIRDAVTSKLRRPPHTSGVSIQELVPRGGAWSSMSVPFKKRPRPEPSSAAPSPSPTFFSATSSLSPSASSSPPSSSSSASSTAVQASPPRKSHEAVTPYAPLRTFPPTANRPPLHPGTPLLLARVRWQEQMNAYQQHVYRSQRSGEHTTTTTTTGPSGSGSGSGSGKSKAGFSFKLGKKPKGFFGGRQKGQNSRLQRKNVLRFFRRSSTSLESPEAALSAASDRAKGFQSPATQQELLPRLIPPDPPSPKDKASSSMFSPSPTPSPPRSSSAAEAERLAAQLATLRHTSPPLPAPAPTPGPTLRLQRAAAMPQRWDASTEALLASLGKEPPRQPSSRPASSTSGVGPAPQSAIPGVRGDRIMPPSMKDRVRQAWVARYRREKRKKKLEAEQQGSKKRKRRGPRAAERVFPASYPKLHKAYRNVFHSVQGGRISKSKSGW